MRPRFVGTAMIFPWWNALKVCYTKDGSSALFLILFSDYKLLLLQLPLQSQNKVINNIQYFSDVWNKIPCCLANVRLLPELSLECLFLTVRFPLSCLSTWKTSIKFWFPLNHMAKPATGANQLSLTGELTHELGWCWASLPEKTESWGFKTWVISQILLCTLPECLYLLFITTASTWSV